MGCLVVLGLFGVLAYTGLRIARRCTNPFRRLVAAGVTALIAGQATINIAGVVGLMPVTGLPAAAHLRRWQRPRGDPRHDRHAGLVRPGRAGRRPGPARPSARPTGPATLGSAAARADVRARPAPAAAAPGGDRRTTDEEGGGRWLSCGRWCSPVAAPAGTSIHCSRSPTACAGTSPTCGSPAWAAPRGWRASSSRPPGYELRQVPGLPAAPLGQPRPGPDPGPDAALDAGRARGPRRRRRRRRGRLRRIRGGAGLPGRVAAPDPVGDPRAERAARAWPTGWACGSPSTSRSASRTSRRSRRCCANARVIGVPLRPAIATLDRTEVRQRGAGALRARPAPAHAVRVRGVAGRPLDQPRGGRRGQGDHRRRDPGAARHRAPATSRSRSRRTCRRRTSRVPYIADMELGYAAADLVLSRGGAMTLAEVTTVGLPAIYVPLPYGNGEQRRNALPVVQAGGGLLVDDAELTPEWIERTVVPLAADRSRLAEMSRGRGAVRPARRRRGAAGVRAGRRRGPALRKDVGVSTTLPAPLSAEDLGHVHLIGVGGVGMSGLARLLLTRGIPTSGSELKDWPALAGLRALGGTIHMRHEAVQSGRCRHRRLLQRDPGRPPGAGRGPGPRAAGAAPVGGARRGDDRPADDRGRRHPRQDDDHLDAHVDPAARRARPVVRHRRRDRRGRAPTPTTAPASTSSPRPTSTTGRS